MLAPGLAERDAAELGLVGQNTYVGKALAANQLRVGLVLGEQRDVLGQCFLSRFVPMVQVRMGHDDCIDTGQHVGH